MFNVSIHRDLVFAKSLQGFLTLSIRFWGCRFLVEGLTVWSHDFDRD